VSGKRVAPASSVAELTSRCHANGIEDYRAFARVSGGGAIEEVPGLVMISTGDTDSMGNPAFVTSPPSDPSGLLARIQEFYSARHLPWIVIAFPEATAALARGAVAAGLRDEGPFPGMVLRPLPENIPASPDGFRVQRVETFEQLCALERTGCRAYGKEYADPDPRWLTAPGISMYLGYDGDQPVSLAALIVAHRIAGIAYVGTVPEQRRHGFAEAVVWMAIADGRELGCDAAYLWATPMGQKIYARMGFQHLLDYHIWSAPHSPLPAAIRRA
jgi:GNAT superfamily N-acetyltransferase